MKQMEKNMRIILSTRNPTKMTEIRTLFAPSGIKVESLDDAGIKGEAIEDGQTLEENAIKKARFAHEQIPDAWCIADDTGLFITALNGEPGIKAARWGGEHLSWVHRTAYCLSRMRGLKDRSATFKTVAVIVTPAGVELTCSGKVTGRMLEIPRCAPKAKMPYSPVFVPEGSDKCWAEMTEEEENAISHRGKAFNQVLEFFRDLQQ